MAETQPLRGPFRVPSAADRPPKQVVRLNVNGHAREVAVRPSDVLLDTLRDDLGLTGTTRGCDMGTCGCCTVHVDGRPVLSCLTLAADVEGRAVTTIEGLVTRDGPDLVQECFDRAGALQCGFCQPGMMMAARQLVTENPDATRDDVRAALSGNLCRCTGYTKIYQAVEDALAAERACRAEGAR